MKKLVDVLGISFLFLFGLFSVGVCLVLRALPFVIAAWAILWMLNLI